MVKIEYIENSGEFMALLKVTETSGSVRECYIPKPIIDLIKTAIQNNTLDLVTILSRSVNVTKDL